MAETDLQRSKSIAGLLKHLSASRKVAALYPPEHPQVQAAVSGLMKASEELLESYMSFTLSIVGEELYFDGALLPEESNTYESLVGEFSARNLTNLSVDRGVTLEEWAMFVSWTARKPEAIEEEGGWRKILEKEKLRHIAVDRKVAMDETWDRKGGGKFRVSRDVYTKTIEAVVASFADARQRQSINLEMVDGVVRLLATSIVDSSEMMSALSQIKGYDEYTMSHSVNVAVLSLLMGSKLQLPGALLHRLGVAALLHDIGKTAVPEEIVNKAGKLTDLEWDLMQSHSLAGSKILSEHKNIDALAIVVAAEHHAREDFQGYPRFHAHKRLHLMSRIVSVVDVYDALTSDRSYRKAEAPDIAMRIILQARGKQLYEPLVKVFAQLTGMYPVGSMVYLDSGDFAVVCNANPNDIFRPKVRLTAKDSSAPEYHMIDLTERVARGGFKRNIVRSVDASEMTVNVAEYLE